MDGIKLNFINRSRDAHNSTVVLFQKNLAPSCTHRANAWLVIENCGYGDHHPIVMSDSTHVSVSDSYGNFTPKLRAGRGDAFQVSLGNTGHTLSVLGKACDPDEVLVSNNLEKGAINVWMYRNDLVLAEKTSVAPGQQAVFRFNPTLWIGAVAQMEHGAAIDSAILDQVHTELSLLGVAKADIVMTGGGPGPGATRLRFSLQNVVMA
jgi:hypothetical protein